MSLLVSLLQVNQAVFTALQLQINYRINFAHLTINSGLQRITMEWRNKGSPKGFLTRLCIKHQIPLGTKEILVQYFKCLLKYKIKDFIITINQSNKNLMKYLHPLLQCRWLRVHIHNVLAKWWGTHSNRCIDRIKAWVAAVVASASSPQTWKS